MPAQEVIAPDGERWRVRRRWSDRPLPRLRRGPLIAGDDAADALAWGLPDACTGADDFLAGIALAVVVVLATVLVVVVILPLLGLALELVLLVALFASGLFGRVFLHRPWTIEAVSLDRPDVSITFAVRGWRRSGRAVLDLAGAIQQRGLPERLPDAAPLSS